MPPRRRLTVPGQRITEYRYGTPGPAPGTRYNLTGRPSPQAIANQNARDGNPGIPRPGTPPVPVDAGRTYTPPVGGGVKPPGNPLVPPQRRHQGAAPGRQGANARAGRPNRYNIINANTGRGIPGSGWQPKGQKGQPSPPGTDMFVQNHDGSFTYSGLGTDTQVTIGIGQDGAIHISDQYGNDTPMAPAVLQNYINNGQYDHLPQVKAQLQALITQAYGSYLAGAAAQSEDPAAYAALWGQNPAITAAAQGALAAGAGGAGGPRPTGVTGPGGGPFGPYPAPTGDIVGRGDPRGGGVMPGGGPGPGGPGPGGPVPGGPFFPGGGGGGDLAPGGPTPGFGGPGGGGVSGLPLTPEFEMGRRALEDQLLAQQAQIAAARGDIQPMLNLQLSRLGTEQQLATRSVNEAMNARGLYDSGIRTQDLALSDLQYERERQNLGLETAQQYRGLAEAEANANLSYNQGLADLGLAIADMLQGSNIPIGGDLPPIDSLFSDTYRSRRRRGSRGRRGRGGRRR